MFKLLFEKSLLHGPTRGEDFTPTQYSNIGTINFAEMFYRAFALGNTMGSPHWIFRICPIMYVVIDELRSLPCCYLTCDLVHFLNDAHIIVAIIILLLI